MALKFSNINQESRGYKFVFIAGLHKSGTTVLADSLKGHPDISGFSNAGVPKDEGQFLQSVFPAAKEFGGPGSFGFRDEMHLTENSPLLTAENQEKIFQEWSRYWDMTKPLLLEKSPPNILKTRFLQELFPNSYFITINRHPIAASYATMGWGKRDLKSLLEHWITCHNIFQQDKEYLENLFVLKYEDFVEDPEFFLKEIYSFLGIKSYKRTIIVEKKLNAKYFKKWEADVKRDSWLKENFLYLKYRRLEKEINKFGYSLYDLQ